MKKTIEKIRQKTPQEKKRFARIVSGVITLVIACIAFLSMLEDINRQNTHTPVQDPVSIKQNDILTEIKGSIQQIKDRTKANVSGAKDAL